MNSLRRLKCTVMLAVSAILAEPSVVADAVAQDPPPPTTPHGTNLHGTDGTDASSGVLSFGCSYGWEGDPRRTNYGKLTCRFASTGIARPSAGQVAERLRDLDVPESQKQTADGFPGVCKAVTAANPQADGRSSTGPHRVYHDRLTKACAEQDAVAGKEALRYGITELWAKTCEAFNYGVREYEFLKVDDSTWRAMDGAIAGGAATIRTVWKTKGASEFSSWNYKQVTSGDPTCVPAPFGECAKDSTTEWTSDAAITLTGCAFFN
jgi:hypothetical protein